MADEIDQANEHSEMLRNIAENYRKPVPALKARGYCYNELCELEFEEGSQQLFCDKHCAKEHAKRNR